MKRFFCFFLLLVSLSVNAQKPVNYRKAYKPIRTALKAKNGSEALKTIQKLLSDSAFARDPKLYAYAIQAELLLCEGFNEKMYLGQKIDTAQFFQANYDMMTYILRCDSVERFSLLADRGTQPNERRESAESLRKQNAPLLLQYFPNINAAARYHYGKRQYAQARKYFAYYFSLPEHELWVGDTALSSTSTYKENLYLDFRAMYELQQYEELASRSPLLLADSALHDQVLDVLIEASNRRADTATYITLVSQALHERPNRLDYFAALANYYYAHRDYQASLALADSLLALDPFNKYYLDCRCQSLFRLGKLDESKIAAERLLQVDTLNANAYYILGFYYVDQAEKVELPRQTRSNLYKSAKQRQMELYRLARPHLEQFRALMPKENERWAPLLYKVYLNLNLGKEFEEINQFVLPTN